MNRSLMSQPTALSQSAVFRMVGACNQTVSVGGDEMENQGQGPAWVVFLLWMLAPLLLFFLILTFTG